MSTLAHARACLVLVLATSALGCAVETGERDEFVARGIAPLPLRRGTLVASGCSLDPGQSAALASPSARQLIEEVILQCFAIDASGAAEPTDSAARAAFVQEVQAVGALGYRVKVGASLDAATSGLQFASAETATLLAGGTWQQNAVLDLVAVVGDAQGLELQISGAPPEAQQGIVSLVGALSSALRPSKQVGLFLPPALGLATDPPDVSAFDLNNLAPLVDRVHVMTLDYSCCSSAAGPTIDSGWAVDAIRFAVGELGSMPIDIAMPLYGEDFNTAMPQRISYSTARQVADNAGAATVRSAGGAPFFDYFDSGGTLHEVWYEDAEAITTTLAAWQPGVLDPNVGVVFYGLGDEDPAVWDRIAEGKP